MLKRLDPPTPPDRHARYRARQRDGKAVAVEYDAAVVDFLVKTHWLLEGEASDRDAVGSAIARMVADATRR